MSVDNIKKCPPLAEVVPQEPEVEKESRIQEIV